MPSLITAILMPFRSDTSSRSLSSVGQAGMRTSATEIGLRTFARLERRRFRTGYSNYFYREMSAVLRWVLLPFLLLAGVTIVAIAGEILRVTGIFDYNILFHNPLMSRLGIITNVLQVVIAINSIFLVLFGFPA